MLNAGRAWQIPRGLSGHALDYGLDIREQLISFPKFLLCFTRSCARSVRPSKVRNETLVAVVAKLAVRVGKRVALIHSASNLLNFQSPWHAGTHEHRSLHSPQEVPCLLPPQTFGARRGSLERHCHEAPVTWQQGARGRASRFARAYATCKTRLHKVRCYELSHMACG
jgi:hypothetical protein